MNDIASKKSPHTISIFERCQTYISIWKGNLVQSSFLDRNFDSSASFGDFSLVHVSRRFGPGYRLCRAVLCCALRRTERMCGVSECCALTDGTLNAIVCHWTIDRPINSTAGDILRNRIRSSRYMLRYVYGWFGWLAECVLVIGFLATPCDIRTFCLAAAARGCVHATTTTKLFDCTRDSLSQSWMPKENDSIIIFST